MRFDAFHLWCLRAFVSVPLAACEAEPTNDYGDMDLAYPDGSFPPARDAGPDAAGDAGPGCQLVVPESCGELMTDACSTSAAVAPGAILGEVKVPSGVMPGGGHAARGTLLIAALPSLDGGGCPGDPRAAPTTPFVALHCTDLTAGKTLGFSIEGVPAGSWFVVAGLDVNGNGVDPCDLVGLTLLPVEVGLSSFALAQPLELGYSASQAIPASCNLTCE
jgi:hypothetical protein